MPEVLRIEDMPDVVPIKDAQGYLCQSRSTILRNEKDGYLTRVAGRGCIRYTKLSILRLLEGGEQCHTKERIAVSGGSRGRMPRVSGAGNRLEQLLEEKQKRLNKSGNLKPSNKESTA